MAKGFKFVIMDVEHTEGDKVIELNAPEDLYDIAALLRDNERYVVESVFSRETGEIAASCCTSRLHNIAGKYTGKDDPVMLVRCQGAFPATGEVLAPFNIGHYVAGFMRGSHTGPLMPVKMNSSVSFFDGPPVVAAMGFCVHEGQIDGSRRLLRSSVLGLYQDECFPQGDRASSAGFLRRRNASVQRTRIRRHREKDGKTGTDNLR